MGGFSQASQGRADSVGVAQGSSSCPYFPMSVAKIALFLVSGKIIPIGPNRSDHYFHALTVEKRCELVYLLFFNS